MFIHRYPVPALVKYLTQIIGRFVNQAQINNIKQFYEAQTYLTALQLAELNKATAAAQETLIWRGTHMTHIIESIQLPNTASANLLSFTLITITSVIVICLSK